MRSLLFILAILPLSTAFAQIRTGGGNLADWELKPMHDPAFEDVPDNHWVYQALGRLRGDSLIESEGRRMSNYPLHRHRIGELIVHAVMNLEHGFLERFRNPKTANMAKDDIRTWFPGFTSRELLGMYELDADDLAKLITQFRDSMPSFVDAHKLKLTIEAEQKMMKTIDPYFKTHPKH